MLLCNEVIENYKLNRDIAETCNLNCFVRQEANNTYNIYVFTMMVQTEEILNNYWEIYVNNISLSFQANLKLDIEKWNIYTIFLVKEKISDISKYRIEQDKFATRKIVLDCKRQYGNVFDNSEKDIAILMQVISKKLFSIVIQNRSLVQEDSFEKLVSEKSEIYGIVLNAENRVDILLDAYRKNKKEQ